MNWKKILLVICLIPIIGIFTILTWPEVLINKTNLAWILSRKEVTEQVSWTHLDVKVEKASFLKSEIQIQGEELCAQLNKTLLDLDFCLQKADINVTIHPHKWPFFSTPQASNLEFSQLRLNKWPEPKDSSSPSNNEEINLSTLWKDFWKLPLPPLTLEIPSIVLPEEKLIKNLDLVLSMNKKEVRLEALELQLDATPKKMQLSLKNWRPDEYFDQKELSGLLIEHFTWQTRITKELLHIQAKLKAFSSVVDLKTKIPSSFQANSYEDAGFVQSSLNETILNLELENIKELLKSLPNKSFATENAKILERIEGGLKASLKFDINGDVITPQFATYSNFKLDNKELDFKLDSSPQLKWQWPLDQQKYLKKTLVATQAQLKLKSIKGHLPKGVQEQWGQLPSPLNNFNGPAEMNLSVHPSTSDKNIEVHIKTDINLSHGDQRLHITTTPILTLDLNQYKLIKTNLTLTFDEVRLRLPNIYLTQAIPQFGPDARIQSSTSETQKVEKRQSVKQQKEEGLPINLNIATPEKSPIKLTTNLIEAPLFIDLDMNMTQGSPDGIVNVRPFETSIFKREVQHKKTVVNFNKGFSTTLSSEVHFPVPNYKIILKIEGPVDEPRPLLSSVPPLPKDDIISVLLFGQPLHGLSENEQANAANRTSQILSQGLLSLSVLYFLSDTPIQSIGVDPETQKVSAQIGLDEKSSLNLSTQEDGTKTVGVRRSIGKGWFIDTSMQKSSLDDQSDQKDYGVLVERIISY